MKLRNKKTGKIAEAIDLVAADEIWGTAKTPSEIFEGWEFYEEPEPTEPLIKNEKIRKAVRAWAEANWIEACLYDADDFSFNADGFCINFNTGFDGKTKIYTISELCGEEEK